MDTVIQILTDWGYGGMFLAAFAAGSILPIGSEVLFVLLVGLGLDPVWCLLSASLGNTLGGMTCYWMGHLGKKEWILKIGVSEAKMERACRFVGGRGALMAFFAFLPVLGEAISVILGLMRSNLWITASAMFAGKFARYLILLLSYQLASTV